MRIFIGMETSGELRGRLQRMGHQAISCDLLPADDGETRWHRQGDVFATLEALIAAGWCPDAGMFHPTCTYLTSSAEWALKDPDYVRYPGVGYHQRVKPGTLTGQARRSARQEAVATVRRIAALPIERIIVENPKGHLSTAIGRPSDIVQPYEFGDDASKGTCLWAWHQGVLLQDWRLVRDPAKRVPGRLVNGIERWSNQTDSNQNRLSPGEDRWKERSKTYPGIADALSKVLVS